MVTLKELCTRWRRAGRLYIRCNEPVKKFTGKIIAIVYRKDDIEEKWVVVPDGVTFSKEEIRRQIHFQKQYFDSEIVM